MYWLCSNPNSSLFDHFNRVYNCSPRNPCWCPISLTKNICSSSENNSSLIHPNRLFAVLSFPFFTWKQWFQPDKDELSQMSRESCSSTRLAVSLSVLRSLLMGAQITHPQLQPGKQQDSFESTSLSCFLLFSLFLLSVCELDYDSLFRSLASCNLSLVKLFACNSRYVWVAPQLFMRLFGFIVISHE